MFFIDSSLISPESALKFMKDFESAGGELHSFELFRGGKLALRGSFAPYDPTKYKHEIYSASKSFTSTAIGFAVSEGLLSVDDKISDIFPDKMPQNPSDNLLKVTVKHLLSMNVGHGTECDPYTAADPVKVFLAHPVPFEPGTHFMYNTPATGILSCIIRKKTGKTLIDYLTPRLFKPLGIENVSWLGFKNGASFGGFGLHASVDDMAKLGLLYLNEGVYGGRRLLSADWVREASTAWSDNSAAGGSKDWRAGYGYQFWRCARGGYRADGAFGQYILIRNDLDVVFAVQSEEGDMQSPLDVMQDLVESMNQPGAATEESAAEYAAGRYECLPNPGKKKLPKNFPGVYAASRNALGITSFGWSRDDDGRLELSFSDGYQMQKLVCGAGEWVVNKLNLSKLGDYLVGRMPSIPYEAAACYSIEAGKITIKLRYLDRPHSQTWVCTASAVGSRITINPSIKDFPVMKLNGKRI